ncbi:MAG: hypothetical protein PHN49_03445 [Candidatus Omnitrophica bacterium]|nr:hypothetical protein [Candidatus Omnitrophota bacterium]MDD5670675.1 hypothetical protein [Candidatus Omnitrophota bacterium]
MPYDAALDKQLYTKSLEDDGGKITVSVHSYNNGPKKIQIIRENLDAEGNTRFAKLGRMTKDELEGIMPFLQEALGVMA